MSVLALTQRGNPPSRNAPCGHLSLAALVSAGSLVRIAGTRGALRAEFPVTAPSAASSRRHWWGKVVPSTSAIPVARRERVILPILYCELNDIIASIAALDADVISIETSRSNMELLVAFTDYRYPNEIGPGVYDIRSPRVPTTEEMVELLRRAAAVLPPANWWVNPDCGLKTRGWEETLAALGHMVEAARTMRREWREGAERREDSLPMAASRRWMRGFR